MTCPDNGICEGIAGTDGCCFECDHLEICPDSIKCDRPELFHQGICKAETENQKEQAV